MLSESELALARLGAPGLRQILAGVRQELHKTYGLWDLPFPKIEDPIIAAGLRPKFTKEEKRILKADGVTIFRLTGESISSQREAKPFSHTTGSWGQLPLIRMLTLPARRMEVGIYTDPDRFFVSDCFYKTMQQQQELIDSEAEELRDRLGLPHITMIIPEVAEATEVIFQHFEKTGSRILNRDFIKPKSGSTSDYIYIRTKTLSDWEGRETARVGEFIEKGLWVSEGASNYNGPSIGAARWIVPKAIGE